jgi:hypothetical protein
MEVSSNIWLGGQNVIAPAHYDTVNNVYIQLKGSKRFRLLPPSSLHQVGLHGRHHPYACQSRVANLRTGEGFTNRRELSVLEDYLGLSDICVASGNGSGVCGEFGVPTEDITSTAPPRYTNELIEVVLHAGDILLIPPFWLHEVSSLVSLFCVCFVFYCISSYY